MRLQVQGPALISDASTVSGQVLSAAGDQWWPVVASPRAKLFPIVASSNFGRDPLDLSSFNRRNVTLRLVHGEQYSYTSEFRNAVLHEWVGHLPLYLRSQFFGFNLLAIFILHMSGPRSAKNAFKGTGSCSSHPDARSIFPTVLLGTATLHTSTTADYCTYPRPAPLSSTGPHCTVDAQ